MKENLKAIIIAGSKNNSSLYLKTLEKAGYDTSYLLIKTKQKFKQALNDNNWDIIISEYKLSKFNALSALEILNESGLNIPFIVVSSKKDNKTIIGLIKKGAANFILKKDIDSLTKLIKSEIAEAKLKSNENPIKVETHHLSHSHFKTLFDNSPTPLWEEEFSELDKYLNKLKEKGVKDFRKYFDDKPSELLKCLSKIKVVNVNKSALKLYKAKNKNELIKSLHKIFTENSFDFFKEELIAISKGKREFEGEVEFTTLNGEKIHVLLKLKIDNYEKGQKRALLSTIDIAHRKKIEESLKLYTTRLEQAEIDASLGSWEFDVVNQRGWWSKQMYVMFGFDESKGVPPYDDYLNHIHPADRELVLNALKKMEKGEAPVSAIFRTNPELISLRYLEPTYNVIRDPDANVLKFTGTSHDITKRKMSEEVLQRLNRELRAISNCNQTLLRASDEQTLLNEICRIIYEETDYPFAWVGYALNDESKTVKPVAFAGAEFKDLFSGFISWSEETEFGNGPAGKAIRSGEILYSQNISKDERMKPWREAILKRGYRSSIVLPLKDENKKPFGVLAIYSSEINIITPNEIRLMEELAGDLAFGITNLRLKSERIKAEDALRESEERFSSIFKLSPMGISIFRASDGCIVNVNDYFVERTGYSREEIINHTAMELNLYANPEEREQNLKKLFENNFVENYEFKIRRKNGEIGYGLSSTTAIKLGGKLHFISMVVDITQHKLAEEALRLSEERFRLIAENTADTIVILDLNLKLIYISPAIERLRGYTVEEAMAIPLNEILTPESFKKAKEAFNEQIAIELSGNADLNRVTLLELEENCKDGSTVWVELSALFLRDENLKPTGILTVTRDITERRQNEELLRESERRFKELANLLPQTIFETDINGKLTFANETALTTYGYSHDDIEKGVYIINTVSEKDRDIAGDDIQRVLKGIPASKNEYEMLRKDGTTFAALTFVGPIVQEGKIIGLRGTTVDITKNKETENELRKLSEAVAQSPASIVITDVKGNIEYVNKTFEEISGYSFIDVKKENPRVLKSGQMPQEKYKELWYTISSGKTWRGELLNKKKNGELFWEDVVISPLKDKNGTTVNFLAVKQDITEKKKIVQELIVAKEEAEEMNRVKTIFFANMSHELRTPFVGIMGFAELLTEILTDPETKEMAEGILKTSVRMKDTLTKILNLSKLEINEIQIFPKKIDIHNLINNVYKQFSIAAVKKNLTFNTYVNVTHSVIVTDETSLIEILNNLVSNAIIYTNKGGIKLSAETQIKNENEMLVIKVADTGIGIPPEKHDLVWKEFRQASEGTTRSYQGTGLGLSISKKYVELLGGNIHLKSEEGKGSTFIIEIPVVSNDNSNKLPEKKLDNKINIEPSEVEVNKKILYVEDDDTSIAVVTLALAKYYSIDTAKNAEIALIKVKDQSFDAILMDINLGRGMNGEELTQVIKKIPGYENIPIIAVTAYASEEDKNEFLSKGMSHYISKPFLIQDLVKLVNEVLQKK